MANSILSVWHLVLMCFLLRQNPMYRRDSTKQHYATHALTEKRMVRVSNGPLTNLALHPSATPMADSDHNPEVLQKCRKCRRKYPPSLYPYKVGSTERAKACGVCSSEDLE